MIEDLSISESLYIDNVKVNTTKLLGRGSYGVVYEGYYHGAKVAVKKLHSIFFEDVSADENIGILKSWRNELQLMSKILHPNIVQFYGVYNSEGDRSLSGNTFIVSELMHKSLRARNLDKPKLKYSSIIDILFDIAAGLCYLHERPSPIMHRDLASKNILLTVSGQAKIADLGVAKIVSQKKESLTRHPGTDAYMPVEAIAFENSYDCSIDVYALGVIGLELGIGRDPKATQCLKKVGMSYIPVEEEERRMSDFADLNSSSNAHLKEFILQCLARMESRITAISALKLLQEQKSAAVLENKEVIALEEQNDQLKMEKEDLKKSLANLSIKQDSHKQEMDELKKMLQEKNNELENLRKKNLESLPKTHESGYITRDPPNKHYNYNSAPNRSQVSVSSHGSLVMPSSASRNAFLRYPTTGSHQSHSARTRPASAIVTGTSAHGRHALYTTQRSHSEDNVLSDEIKCPPPLPDETISTSQVIRSLAQYCSQINNEFEKLKAANSAVLMAIHMETLKHIMEKSQSYIISIPQHVKTHPEVGQLLTNLNAHIELLRKVGLDLISTGQTDRLSQIARLLVYYIEN